MSHPPATPHDPIEEIGTDVFMVRGSVKLNPVIRLSRNMAILRHDGELTLVDPIRLAPDEERRLESLGRVTRILRLGAMHGLDDAYTMERFGAELWATGASDFYPVPAPTKIVDESTALPFPDAELFCFRGTNQPEAALLLTRGPGLLLTCDAIQHWGDYRHNNLPARLLLPLIGFPKRTLVGPIWVKAMTPEGGNLEPEFQRLLELEFDQLLSAHGSFLAKDAHAACVRAVAERFGS